MLSILTCTICNNNVDSRDNSTELPDKSKNSFETCFGNIDTSKAGKTKGCSGGTYKLINDKYVIRIFPDFNIQFDSCYIVTINSSNAERLTELLIFENNNANLTNICTDIIIVNNPKPTRQLYAQSGQLIIGFSDPIDLYGSPTCHTTILIKRLVFIDRQTGDKIVIENELLWKVLDTGTPG
ncbi:MAG: hypothetical protein IPI31_15485 [Bacteroidetes bacterium]|nr:hypothetical protein [Bacteroidota bacterium]